MASCGDAAGVHGRLDVYVCVRARACVNEDAPADRVAPHHGFSAHPYLPEPWRQPARFSGPAGLPRGPRSGWGGGRGLGDPSPQRPGLSRPLKQIAADRRAVSLEPPPARRLSPVPIIPRRVGPTGWDRAGDAGRAGSLTHSWLRCGCGFMPGQAAGPLPTVRPGKCLHRHCPCGPGRSSRLTPRRGPAWLLWARVDSPRGTRFAPEGEITRPRAKATRPSPPPPDFG
ncbi:uncharacterized protein LOC128570542 [Nycticebus coucang]|uniref:uncharacterized protein LOC128570542 n=1 Tax=Nycticebus coucang TaxID=9470 RepID=UPI00234C75C9|nr:uncharacterized protein LOC128570542 [Nycticebus coucang]